MNTVLSSFECFIDHAFTRDNIEILANSMEHELVRRLSELDLSTEKKRRLHVSFEEVEENEVVKD